MSNTTRTPTPLRNAVKAAIGTSLAVPIALAATPAMSADMNQSRQATIQQLRAQMERIQDRLNELATQNRQLREMQQQQQQQLQMAKAEAKEAVNKPGFTVGGTRIKIGGYFKFDATYDFSGNDHATIGPYVAKGGTSNDPTTNFTAKQSRLTISTTTPTPIGDIGGYFEFDLYGAGTLANGDYEPRARLAYLTYGNWLFGKAWSTFSDFHYGTMLNFFGPSSQIFERQAQIRYTFHLANGGSLALAVENPDGHKIQAASGGAVASGPGDEQFPDLVARYQGSMGNLSFQAAVVGMYIEANGPNGEENTFAYGLDLGGSYTLPTGTTFMLTGTYGQGDGKYVYEPYGGVTAYFDGDGDLETIERYGYIATISQKFNDQWTGNIVWGQAFSEDYLTNVAGFEPHKQSSTLEVNMLYSPVDPLTLGVAYDRVYYENQAGEGNSANRLQFSTIYHF